MAHKSGKTATVLMPTNCVDHGEFRTVDCYSALHAWSLTGYRAVVLGDSSEPSNTSSG